MSQKGLSEKDKEIIVVKVKALLPEDQGVPVVIGLNNFGIRFNQGEPTKLPRYVVKFLEKRVKNIAYYDQDYKEPGSDTVGAHRYREEERWAVIKLDKEEVKELEKIEEEKIGIPERLRKMMSRNNSEG